MITVTILGLEDVALALAGDILVRLGRVVEVRVWVPTGQREVLDSIAKHNRLYLVGPNIRRGEFFPHFETVLGEAVHDANFIIVTGPASRHSTVLKILTPHDLSNSTLVALPGCAFALEAQRFFTPERRAKVIVETNTKPYVCNRKENVVTIEILKSRIAIAASGKIDANVKGTVELLFPQSVEWYQDLASIFFSNTNPVSRPVGLIKARAYLVSGGCPPPLFYKTLVASAIDWVLAIDYERLVIVEALGLESDTHLGFFEKWFELKAADLTTVFQNYEGCTKIHTPNPIDLRYLEDDVKYNMVLWVEIASACGIKVPVMEAILVHASAAFCYEFRKNGRTLSSLGLTNASKDVILARLNGVVA
ncbi:vitopine synthase [Agrobacterium vitis]|uniref:Vitopine synthase n=2 Tax=Agrobacterium TaxID=357 RepID=A0A2Z2PWD5_AGRTU|nr:MULTISPECIES: NAD/NADP octopine/nopaline dehydrogenase family protein [Rhizobium/Agrobacterium group]MCF1502041.1 vitopine synthase [Allorhizobium sp. Av2]ASK46918.1 vitopine synthase [Agrobacterium radiobacter]KAA3503407.1 vitopine synthase [Agrobacterium vitis]KAA3519287.1 vitopine synthase [Agrobacterium vitis]MCE6078261.1 vitopine synthase [Agrobacterium vitis]